MTDALPPTSRRHISQDGPLRHNGAWQAAARPELAALRAEIAAAETTLAALRAAIREARSDPGLAALQRVRAQNERLLETNRQATAEVSTVQAALDVAVQASQTDALTGLRNRVALWDRLSHELDLAGRHGHHVAVYLLDLDGFKAVNDRLGHAAGDRVLQRVARVLAATVRASDTVCRLGGDEFVVVAACGRREDVEPLARKIEELLREPFLLEDEPMAVSVSIGFSVYPEDGDAPEALLHSADAAMYRRKRLGAVHDRARGSLEPRILRRTGS